MTSIIIRVELFWKLAISITLYVNQKQNIVLPNVCTYLLAHMYGMIAMLLRQGKVQRTSEGINAYCGLMCRI